MNFICCHWSELPLSRQWECRHALVSMCRPSYGSSCILVWHWALLMTQHASKPACAIQNATHSTILEAFDSLCCGSPYGCASYRHSHKCEGGVRMAFLHVPLCAHAEEPPGLWRALGGDCQRPPPGGPPQNPHHHGCPPAGEVSSLSLTHKPPFLRHLPPASSTAR